MLATLDRGGGVSIAWESRGEKTPAILLLPGGARVCGRRS